MNTSLFISKLNLLNLILIKFIYLIVFNSFFVSSLYASDLAREKRLADEIVDSIMDGDALFLQSGNHKFLSIYMMTEQQPKGAAIIMHGRGFHPDWEQVVNPLRTGLAERGWHTLSIQMPVLDKSAKYYDYVPIFHESFPRISAAVKYLKEQGITKIVLIAHSCSIHMSMAWFEQTKNTEVDAFVAIGMGATDYKQPMASPFKLDRLTIPVLDIYGSADYPAVKNKAPQRLTKIEQAGHKHSRQQVIPDADHYFTETGQILLEAISDWLDILE